MLLVVVWDLGDQVTLNKDTNHPYGLDFPVITIKDIVRAQESLLDHLGIEKTSMCYRWFYGWNATIAILRNFS
jgi:hypothetical protein